MTDPSLYSFSDDFFQNLLNLQSQQSEDSSDYIDYPAYDNNSNTEEPDINYEDRYNELSDKYEELLSQVQQLQENFSNRQQFDPSLDYNESDNSNYVTDFIYDNILGVKNYSNKGFQTFDTYEEGKDALINQLKLYQTGKTRNPVGPNSTLLEAMSVYAPSSDNNDPVSYADFIAKKLGVSPNTPISELDVNKWADAVEQREGNKTGNNPGNLRKYAIGGINYDIPEYVNFY